MQITPNNKKILVSIIHVDGDYNNNFDRLKVMFCEFDIYVPKHGFYGNRWTEIKRYFLETHYDSLLLICSDVSIICGDIIHYIKTYANDKSVGCYGFGTIYKSTFNWQRYDNIHLIKHVPFIEGYCFGVNKEVFKYLELENVYGYGIDVEIGYKSNINGLKCIINNEVCIRHEYGKSYDDNEATKEYRAFLTDHSNIYWYLRQFNIPTPM